MTAYLADPLPVLLYKTDDSLAVVLRNVLCLIFQFLFLDDFLLPLLLFALLILRHSILLGDHPSAFIEPMIVGKLRQNQCR